MSTDALNRRRFFGWLTGGAAVGCVPAVAPPPQAWIIVAVGWHYNDEVTSEDGEYARTQLFYERAAAEAECHRLCDEFFRQTYPTPAEFEPDWDCYELQRGPGFDEGAVTWDQLRAAGFPDPFYIQELTVRGGEPDE